MLFLGPVFLGHTQNQQLRAFTIEDGLPQSQVYDMVQDENGYLWVATQGGGVARFDGSNFKIYNTSNGLQNNYVNALFASKDTLFIGTNRGLSIKVKQQFFSSEMPQINTIKKIRQITFILTAKGIYHISEGVKPVKLSLNHRLDTSQIKDLIYDGTYYWIASSQGLFKTKHLNAKAAEVEELVEDDFVALLNYKDKIIAATASEGVFIFEPNHFEESILVLESLKINALSLNDKDVWIATADDGIHRLNMVSYTTELVVNAVQGLSVSNVQKVLLDRQSNIWIATSGGGFYKYFQNNFKHYDTSSGLSGSRVYAIHSNDNTKWVSQSGTGLSKLDGKGAQKVELPEFFSAAKIKTITSGPQGRVWFGSEGHGIWLREIVIKDTVLIDKSKIDELSKIKIPITSRFDYEINKKTGFPEDWIKSLQTDQDTVWATTYSSGIIKFGYQPSTSGLQIYNTFSKENGIKDLAITHSLFHDNQLWYATQNGHLGCIKDDAVSDLGLVLNDEVAINTLLINKNTIYLGTAGKGIWWAKLENQLHFKKLKGSKPLTSENCFQLIFDNEGYLWSGTERGVDKIELSPDQEILDVFHFGKNDGFLGIETTLNAVDKDENGHLWFGTIYGLTEFIPSVNTGNSLKPELFFEDVKVAYESVDSIDLKAWTNSKKVLRLSPNQNQVSFSFKSVDLDHPDIIEYRTALNNTEWSPWSSSSSSDFSGLAYGAHTFSVQSRNFRWQESDVKQFSFFIERPFYKKIWVQWLAAALVLLVVFLIIATYIKRLKQRNKSAQQRLEIENHLLELEQKALRLQMNPHFMFNVLNGIKAMAVTKPEVMNTTINSFAALLRATLANSRKDRISLEEEMATLKHYIELEQQMSQKPFEFQLSLESDYGADEIYIPPMLIQPFVENAIRHGILKGSRKGQLDICFATSETFLEVTITDNGLGIYESQKAKTASDHQSMALQVTEERLASISGKDALQIAELKADGKVKGTCVFFKTPLETDY